MLEEGSEFVWFMYIVCHKNVNLEVSHRVGLAMLEFL